MGMAIDASGQPQYWMCQSQSPWIFQNGAPWAYTAGLEENDLDGSFPATPGQGNPATGWAPSTTPHEAQQDGTYSSMHPMGDACLPTQQAVAESPYAETPGLVQTDTSSPSEEVPGLGMYAESPTLVLLPAPTTTYHNVNPDTRCSQQQSSTNRASPENPTRERNRRAADKYRIRQRNANNMLNSRRDELEKANKQLTQVSTDLSQQVCSLRHLLLEHSHCGCKLVQQYLQNHAANWVKGQQQQQQHQQHQQQQQQNQQQQPCEPQVTGGRKRRARLNQKAALGKSS